VEHLTIAERAARGRAARERSPRSAHGCWQPAADRRDPVDLLEEQAASRPPELVPIRYGRNARLAARLLPRCGDDHGRRPGHRAVANPTTARTPAVIGTRPDVRPARSDQEDFRPVSDAPLPRGRFGRQPRAESRWPPVAAVLVFVVLNTVSRLWLPSDTIIAMPWLPPVLELALVGVLVASDPLGVDRRAHWLRKVSITLVFLLVAAALWSTVVLTAHLITGSPQTNSAGYLLLSGALVFVGNNLAFSLLYWQFDAGGPLARMERLAPHPEFAFPQQLNPNLAPPGWRPVFYDYLYLGFTNSIAFSPTDVMPLAHWAKLAMAIQSTVSLAVIGIVIARAVNVLT